MNADALKTALLKSLHAQCVFADEWHTRRSPEHYAPTLLDAGKRAGLTFEQTRELLEWAGDPAAEHFDSMPEWRR